MEHTVCIVTSTRAEWGLLRRVWQEMEKTPGLAPVIVATGAHLESAFGRTVRELEADGAAPAACIPILRHGTASRAAMAKTAAEAITAFTDYFTAHRPDAVLVLGDRYEIFAVGAAAAMLCIPLIHISGGDVTRGAVDDWMRHCLTKMASLHFPSCEEYARRVIRMGEDPRRVENVGGLGDENLRKMPLLGRAALAKSIGFDLAKPYLLVTYHPETATGASPLAQLEALLGAMDDVNARAIFTKANADAGGEDINRRIDEVCAANPGRYIAFASMGALRYLSAMKYCAAVVGNSSSGVVETPSLGVPAVNIGRRQDGRILCANVLCCEAERDAVRKALQTAMSEEFRAAAAAVQSPYNGGDSAALLHHVVAPQSYRRAAVILSASQAAYRRRHRGLPVREFR